MRIGVIGLGTGVKGAYCIGRMHLQGYKAIKGVKIACISDLNPDSLREAVAEYGAKGYRSGQEMLEKEKIDAVSICTPPKSHFELTKLAAEKKVNILCEKPMAPTIENCEKMIKVCEENSAKLMIGFKKRFVPTYMFLKEKMDTQLGAPLSVFYRYVCTGGTNKDWFWAEDDGGGPLVENTVHAVDILRLLIGDVKRVYSEADNFLAGDRGQLDSAIIALRFKNGAIAGVRAGCWAEGPLKIEHMMLDFPEATAEVSGEFDKPDHLKIAFKGTSKLEEYVFNESNESNRVVKDEIEYFIRCIREDRKPEPTGLDGKKALEICLAIKEAARKKMPITIN